MAQYSMFWDDTDIGDAALLSPYDETEFDDFFELFVRSYGNVGVIIGYLNELAVTSPGANSIDVASGGAMVKGKGYWNSASQNLVPGAPAGAARWDYVVVQTDWAAKTIRLAIHTGAEGGGLPALTQTDGTTWEIPLAYYQIAVGGAISSLTDVREFVGHTVDDAVNNGITDVVEWAHGTSGAPAAGIGTAVRLKADTDANRPRLLGRIAMLWQAVTDATRRSVFKLFLNYGNTEIEAAVISAPASAAGVAGNARGNGAVDFQGFRNAATQVASGIFSVLSGGYLNQAAGAYSVVGGGNANISHTTNDTVGGGSLNEADGPGATASGGVNNKATAGYATTAGGLDNIVTGDYGSIGGGYANEVAGDYGTVAGGSTNAASGNKSTIGGGDTNTASGVSSVIGGGDANDASSNYCTIGGGNLNEATSTGATIGGGDRNDSKANYTTVAGGSENAAMANYATVGGGRLNEANTADDTVGGGRENVASGGYSTIPGGYENATSGAVSFATGRGAVANVFGKHVQANGYFGTAGDAQGTFQVMMRLDYEHSDALFHELFLDGAAARLTIPANTVWTFRIDISATTQGSGSGMDVASYQIVGNIENDNGTTTVNASAVTVIYEDIAAWDVQINAVASAANDALVVEGKDGAAAGERIRWVARVELTEVSFA